MNDNLLGQAVDAAAAVLRDRPSALISDVDGTLSPIVPTPDEAVVLLECRRALEELAGRLDLVAVISGRTAEEARRMVGLDGLLYVGNHGLERWDSANGYRSEATAFEGAMNELRATLEEELRRIPGTRMEDKVTILSLHYRGAPEPEVARREILGLLGRLLPPGRFAVREGKMVVEISPPLRLDKGTVVEHLVKERGLRGAVFLGDDVTDVDAMRALKRLRESGLTSLAIGVAGDDMPDTLAEESAFLLPGPTAVAAFLERLARVLLP
ncbi:MAG TPA: trehalose-phosphatase [Dehalococcoidia bacterium]|nr:trehalose-phosphatase [Dehalococcoidia bacterium]